MNRIKLLRTQKGLTQVQLAKLMNISQSNLSGWESEKWQPDNDSLINLANYFDVSIDYLLGREEKKPPDNQEGDQLYVPEQYRDVMVAFHEGADNLTQEDIDNVVRYIEFLKAKKK